MKTWKTSVVLGSLLFASIGWGQAVTVPNSFQAGQAARAADVNANFDAVAAGVNTNATEIEANTAEIAVNAVGILGNTSDIDTNTSSITANSLAISANQSAISALAAGSGLPVFSAGNRIGSLGHFDPARSDIYTISDSGYWFMMHLGSSPLYLQEASTFLFSGPGCSGRVYVNGLFPYPSFLQLGVVVAPPGREISLLPPYYVPRNQAYQTVDYNSKIGGNGLCVAEVGSAGVEGEVFLNDEAITGVPNTAYPTPYSIGVP